MPSYQIAIPTYGRHEGVKKLTLSYLQTTDIDPSVITLFVADEEEKVRYEEANPGYRVVVGERGLVQQRQFISRFYPKSTPVFSFDDDISAIEVLELLAPLLGTKKPLDHPCKLTPLTGLHSVLETGFGMAEERGIGLWGFYSVRNKGFLHPKVTTGLKFIMGHSMGFYAGDHAFENILEFPMKDDYYLSLYHHKFGKGTLRFDGICVKAKQHSGSGGTCEDLEAKLQINNETVDKIVSTFPELASVKMRKTKDEWLARYKELRLKPITTETIPYPEVSQ